MYRSARSTSVPRSRARGIPPATGSTAPGLPFTAASRQCYNTAADGEPLKSVPESFAVGGIQTALPAVAVKGGVRCTLLCHLQNLLLLRFGFEDAVQTFGKKLLECSIHIIPEIQAYGLFFILHHYKGLPLRFPDEEERDEGGAAAVIFIFSISLSPLLLYNNFIMRGGSSER